VIIVAHISRKGEAIADVTYMSGILVEVRVAKKFRTEKIHLPLTHSDNKELAGTWEEALDNYFNEGQFDSRDNLFPGEINRVGTAREHRTLFQIAAHALRRDLEPRGYLVDVEFP
jgi:hypothetical protein